MKILEVNKLYYPWIGGVEKIVQQIAEELNGKNDFEIEVLCCQPKGKGKEEIIHNVKVFKALSFGIFWGLPISFDFFRLFKKLSREAEIIDFHHPFPLGDLAIFLRKPKAKLVVHYHSDIVRQKVFNFLVKPLINRTLKKAKKIIVSNPNLIKSSPYLRKFQQKCEVIPFGVDLAKFEKFNNREVENLKKKYNNFVLFVGRLNYYKGLGYLIEAMKDIQAKLVIIGEGPLKELLKKKIQELGIKDKVIFLPFITEENKLANFYKACSVFVLPSIFKSEAFGIVLIEAMACRKPVISTNIGTGTSFVNQDGVTGFVIPPKNSQALAQAIKKILENQKLAQEFGQNARKRVIEEFSLEKMLDRTSAVYGGI
ncbi:MAG: glycosyltransferase [Candidatus Nealsonbacteria bacterium]|nr:MAG: glycosyltransferase [Candidatus Nealsonbacteria bacterium]